jgi:uncharacterized membrane protein
MNNNTNQSHKSSFGMKANKAVVIMYIIISVLFWVSYVKYFAWIIPVLFFIIEKNNKFLKYNAVQAFCISVIRAVISLLLTLVGHAISLKDLSGITASDIRNRWVSAAMLPGEIDVFIGIGFIVAVLYIIIKALDYVRVRLPGIGVIAGKLSKISEEE